MKKKLGRPRLYSDEERIIRRDAYNKMYRESHREEFRDYNKKHYYKTLDYQHERCIKKTVKARQENPGLANHYNKLRETKKLNATPKWLTKKQLNEIKLIYLNCPKGYEVDHIIPLSHKEVRGLHVPWNLQYLTKEENRVKHNKFDGTHLNESWRL